MFEKGSIVHAWELHPALVHYPIAFLTGGVLIDIIARFSARARKSTRVAAGLLLAGVASGIAAAFAGAISYFTVPAHTEGAHERMHAHLALAIAALAIFAFVAGARWRRRDAPASSVALASGLGGCALLICAALLGGNVVYRGGAGVDPRILAPAIAQGHNHGDGHHAASHDSGGHGTNAYDEHHDQLPRGRSAARNQRPLFDPDEDLRPPRALP